MTDMINMYCMTTRICPPLSKCGICMINLFFSVRDVIIDTLSMGVMERAKEAIFYLEYFYGNFAKLSAEFTIFS